MLFIQPCFFVDIDDIFVNFELQEKCRRESFRILAGIFSDDGDLVFAVTVEVNGCSTGKLFAGGRRLPILALSF